MSDDVKSPAIRTIVGQREKRKSQQAQIDELSKKVDILNEYVPELEGRIAKLHQTLKSSVNSVNAASVLLSSVER